MDAVTDATFASVVLQAKQPVVVDFWAPWCVPCQRLAPVLEEVAQELGDEVRIVKVNTDENPEITAKCNVMSIPTLIVFKNGAEVGRTVGLMSKAALLEQITAAVR